MKAASLDYLRPADLAEALLALENLGRDARVLGGGQSLMPMLNMRLVEAGTLIDISGLAELRQIRKTREHLEIGAAVTQQEILDWPELGSVAPLLKLALSHVGHRQTRHRGTFAGSIAHADPSSEQPLAAAVLDADIVLQSSKGSRVAKAAQFFLGPLTTDRRPDEIIVAIRVPVRRPGQGAAFSEVARRAGDFAIVAVAAIADRSTIRFGVGAASDVPVVIELSASAATEIDGTLNALAWQIKGHDDQHATARYRRELIRHLGRQTILEALQCRS